VHICNSRVPFTASGPLQYNSSSPKFRLHGALGVQLDLPKSSYLRRRRRLCVYFGLFVCLSVRRITEKVVNGFWRNFLEGRAWPRDQVVKFWWRSGSPSGSRSPKSKIRIHWIIEKVPIVDSDQSCIANLHCTVIQQFYYAGVRWRCVLSEYF